MKMGEFQRSPSKVWWPMSDGRLAANWRNISTSPGSQDSGFSDTETSSHLTPKENVAVIKKLDTHNLTSNVKEKCTPDKSIKLNLIYENSDQMYYLPQTPVRKVHLRQHAAKSEPAASVCSSSSSKEEQHQKVSRNLFRSISIDRTTTTSNQYANNASLVVSTTSSSSEDCWLSNDNIVPECAHTLPKATIRKTHLQQQQQQQPAANLSAPPDILQQQKQEEEEEEADESFNQSVVSSSDDSELEIFFLNSLQSPKHTSTPKTFIHGRMDDNRRLRRLQAMNLLHKYQDERVPPIVDDRIDDNGAATTKWLADLKEMYELEVMTTLQCKSIAGDLHDKVMKLATDATSHLRLLIHYNQLILREFDFLKNEETQCDTHKLMALIKECLHKTNIRRVLNVRAAIAELHLEWNQIYRSELTKAVKELISGLEDPQSELDVRVKLTALTSLTLRNEALIEVFIDEHAVHVIATICEKCEGSSVRGLALRALTTLCISGATIRKLENADGIHLIVDTIVDEGRPEPERIEAIALLAQITAPWIEDNHSVLGLSAHLRKLVKCLTQLIIGSKCCQNVLLCAAALANLTGIEPHSIKYVLHHNAVNVLLRTIKVHGSGISVYLLEQLANLIANMCSQTDARHALTAASVPTALIYFLQVYCTDIEAMKRLQQKIMISLTRLCALEEAARQVVDIGGVSKLVKLCKERNERFDSDAILVAALTTLRKISEVCGVDVVEDIDYQELIKPRLMDSFMAYAAQNESLV